MDKKIEELNLKYQNLLEDSDNYNNQFTKHLQNFYQYAIEAGDGDFQKGIQATKKFKKMIESLQESAKLSNQYIVKEAYDSIVILLLTLLRSTRWQDNNAGIQIIICYLESNFYLKMDKISQVFKFNLIKYFEYPEEILLENTSKLLTLLMNSNDIFNKEEYLEIQNKLIQSIHSSLILTENYQDYLQTITNLLSQNPNSLLGLKYKNSNICTQERYQSKTQLAPLLQILKEISLKTQLFNYQDLLIKCCMVNQKQTQLTAFNMLNDAIDIESNDINQVIINSLSHNNLEIRKIGILLATKKFGNNNGNMIQEVRLLIYLNSELFERSQQSILLNFSPEQQKKFENENFVLIANICSLQVQSENELIKEQSWRNLYRIYNKQDIKQENQYENQIITSQIIQLITKFNLEHNAPRTFYYYQHFINKILQFVQDQDKQILIETVCKFIGKQNSKNEILKQIFIQLDMPSEELIQNKYYNQQEWDTFLKDYDKFYQESKQKKLGEMSNKK